MVFCRRGGSALGPVPEGCRALAGPAAVVAARFEASPVGPYLELAVVEPVRSGLRLGRCVTTMVVDSPASRVGGRLNWGFPKELGTLAWSCPTGGQLVLRWDERDVEVSTLPRGPRFPVVIPIRTCQRRGDDVVTVPGRLRGWGRFATAVVGTPPADLLAGLAGRHLALHVSGARVVVGPARQPGQPGRLRALRSAPEPALSWGAQGD